MWHCIYLCSCLGLTVLCRCQKEKQSLANVVLCKEICQNISKFVVPVVLYLHINAKITTVHQQNNISIALLPLVSDFTVD